MPQGYSELIQRTQAILGKTIGASAITVLEQFGTASASTEDPVKPTPASQSSSFPSAVSTTSTQQASSSFAPTQAVLIAVLVVLVALLLKLVAF